jgi:hypothetical protein
LLVVDGQLHGDAGQLVEVVRRIGVVVLLVFEIEVAHRVAMHTVESQQNHDREVGNKNRGIKEIPVIKPFEGLVAVLHFEVMAQAVLGCKCHKCGCP